MPGGIRRHAADRGEARVAARGAPCGARRRASRQAYERDEVAGIGIDQQAERRQEELAARLLREVASVSSAIMPATRSLRR